MPGGRRDADPDRNPQPSDGYADGNPDPIGYLLSYTPAFLDGYADGYAHRQSGRDLDPDGHGVADLDADARTNLDSDPRADAGPLTYTRTESRTFRDAYVNVYTNGRRLSEFDPAVRFGPESGLGDAYRGADYSGLDRRVAEVLHPAGGDLDLLGDAYCDVEPVPPEFYTPTPGTEAS